PVWFADSARLAVFAQKAGKPETREWYSVPANGDPPRQLNWVRWAGEHQYFGTPTYITPSFAVATLARRPGEIVQLYSVPMPPDALLTSDPQPLTGGAAWSAQASLAAGKMAFQSGTPEIGLWSLPADTDAGRVLGPLERLNKDRSIISSVAL